MSEGEGQKQEEEDKKRKRAERQAAREKRRAKRKELWKNRWVSVQAWRRRYALTIVVGVGSVAIIVLVARVSPLLPVAYLFWLKLAAFGITAVLGMVGVLTDFKDENKKLTAPGRFNLVGLGLALVIGVTAQWVENKKVTRAEEEQKRISDDEKKALKDLNEKNQAVLADVKSLITKNNDILKLSQGTLHQVGRNLETIGDTILVRYSIKFTSEDQPFKEAAKTLAQRIKALPKDFTSSFQDNHTFVTGLFAGPGSYTAYFDKYSALMPKELSVRWSLENVPFTIIVYRGWPKPGGTCYDIFHAGVEYTWNEALTTLQPPDRNLGVRLAPPELRYATDREDNLMEQFSESGSVFKRVPKSGIMLSAQDFGGAYVRVLTSAKIRFASFSVQIGQRYFVVPVKEFVADECGGLRYRLPNISK